MLIEKIFEQARSTPLTHGPLRMFARGHFRFVEAWPRNTTGEIRRLVVRQQLRDTQAEPR